MKDIEVYGKIIEMFIGKMTSPEVGQIRLEVSTFKLILERSRLDEPSLVKFTLTDDGKVVNVLSDSEASMKALNSFLRRSMDFIYSLIGEEVARDVIISSMLEDLDDLSEHLIGRSELVRSIPEPFSTLLEEEPLDHDVELEHEEIIELFQEVFQAYLKDLSVHTDLSAFKLKLSILREKHDLIKNVDLNRNNNLSIDKETWALASKEDVKVSLLSIFNSMVGLSTFLLGKEEALKKANRIFHYYFSGKEEILKEYGMMDEVLEGSFRWKLSTGIEELDIKMKGGLPSGASVLLASHSGIERDLFISGMLRKGLVQGCSVLMVTSKEPTRSVRMLLRSNGLDPDELEEEGKLRLVDWFSWRGERIIGVERDGYALKSSKILSNLSIAINKGLRELEFSSTKLGIIHIIGPATNIFEFNQVYNFVQRLRAKFKDEGMASIFVLEKGSLSGEMESKLKEMFDGNLSIDKTGDGGRIDREILIGSMSGVDFDTSPMKFRIMDNMIVPETKSTVREDWNDEELAPSKDMDIEVEEKWEEFDFEKELAPSSEKDIEKGILSEELETVDVVPGELPKKKSYDKPEPSEKTGVRPKILRRRLLKGSPKIKKKDTGSEEDSSRKSVAVKPKVRRKLKTSNPPKISTDGEDDVDLEGIDLGLGGGLEEKIMLEALDSLRDTSIIKTDAGKKKVK
jgi:KaiC/GvpD/RAD55 family RecA-like ATPase